jgi:hypothetical protein
MSGARAKGKGTPAAPWVLKTPPGTSEFEAYRDPDADPPARGRAPAAQQPDARDRQAAQVSGRDPLLLQG